MPVESLNAFSVDFFSLKGKTAIVTGENSGLGQVFAMTLAKASANVLIPSFVKNNDKIKEMIERQGVGMGFMQVDITAEGTLQKTTTARCGRFDTVDTLANNADICKLNKMLDFRHTDWDLMIDMNLTAASELSHGAAKIMIPQESGKITNICSSFFYLGGQWSSACPATKYALVRFTEAYCDELDQYDIQANDISPGYYVVDITPVTCNNPETNQHVFDYIPANRRGGTQDLMGAAVSLVSPASNHINGYLLVVDGGCLAR